MSGSSDVSHDTIYPHDLEQDSYRSFLSTVYHYHTSQNTGTILTKLTILRSLERRLYWNGWMFHLYGIWNTYVRFFIPGQLFNLQGLFSSLFSFKQFLVTRTLVRVCLPIPQPCCVSHDPHVLQ